MALHFTPTHHAMLFACLTRALGQSAGQAGLDAAEAAVMFYGEQRGRRMAARTVRDGLTPDAAGYLAYGEWSAEPGTSCSSVVQTAPEVVTECTRCPWNDLWRSRGLLEYGSLYCRRIDAALAHAYCGMTLDTESCLSRGDRLCRFVLRDRALTPEAEAALALRRAALGDSAKMPWGYHCSHLYSAFLLVSKELLGMAGASACVLGLEDFGEEYGPEMQTYILRHAADDFEKIPVKEDYE